eukprot:6049488-Pyramimonas_sp.AAC.1
MQYTGHVCPSSVRTCRHRGPRTTQVGRDGTQHTNTHTDTAKTEAKAKTAHTIAYGRTAGYMCAGC